MKFKNAILITLSVAVFFACGKESELKKSPAEDPNMVLVKGGVFEMGSIMGEPDELPIRKVSLDDYYISKYEVTQKQWKEVMGSNPSHFSTCDNCPVENISWDMVQEFIMLLNKKTGIDYRMPTEAEWEYAARGGAYSKNYQYAGTDAPTQLFKYANFCDQNCSHRWKNQDYNDGFGTTAPVGSLLPNELGLFDMSGNVSEWCSDWYGNYDPNALDNPTGAKAGRGKVARDVSWAYGISNIRVSNRQGLNPKGGDANIGFRLAASAVPTSESDKSSGYFSSSFSSSSSSSHTFSKRGKKR